MIFGGEKQSSQGDTYYPCIQLPLLLLSLLLLLLLLCSILLDRYLPMIYTAKQRKR